MSYAETLLAAHFLRAAARELAETGALDEALAQVDRADSVGPILDPTAYMRNVGRMHEDRETLRAVRALAQLGDE